MKIELKAIRYFSSMSEETNCYEAGLYVDGRKIGRVSNRGTGGGDDFHGTQRDFDAADEWSATCDSPNILADSRSAHFSLRNAVFWRWTCWLSFSQSVEIRSLIANVLQTSGLNAFRTSEKVVLFERVAQTLKTSGLKLQLVPQRSWRRKLDRQVSRESQTTLQWQETFRSEFRP